jgi:hemerythrin superfamily protein
MATSTSAKPGPASAQAKGRPGFPQAGIIAAAAMAGAAVGFAASFGRRFALQNFAPTADWLDALTGEHRATLALFDRLAATDDSQLLARSHLLSKLKVALGRHALAEENAVYPALRDANSAHDADALNAEHGYVKTYLYELDNMPAAGQAWRDKLRAFRALLEEHIRMEEDEVFPGLRIALGEEGNRKLSAAVQREGMKLA